LKTKGEISAVFKFSRSGFLKMIYLNAETQEDQKILQRGLFALLKPQKFNLIKKLFKRSTSAD
jgi:hypothetical protein